MIGNRNEWSIVGRDVFQGHDIPFNMGQTTFYNYRDSFK